MSQFAFYCDKTKPTLGRKGFGHSHHSHIGGNQGRSESRGRNCGGTLLPGLLSMPLFMGEPVPSAGVAHSGHSPSEAGRL